MNIGGLERTPVPKELILGTVGLPVRWIDHEEDAFQNDEVIKVNLDHISMKRGGQSLSPSYYTVNKDGKTWLCNIGAFMAIDITGLLEHGDHSCLFCKNRCKQKEPCTLFQKMGGG